MESFLTLEQIDSNRMAIYSRLLERMDSRGGSNFKSLHPNDIKWLFDTYDLTFFKGQISHRLETTHGEITFHVRGQTSDCGYSISLNSRHYFFDISTSILKTVGKNEHCSDRALCLMHVVEHQIIHFLMLLYDYHEKIPGYAMYSMHGSLYRCMLRLFFGDVDSSHDLEGKEKKIVKKPSTKYKTLVICHGRKHARVANLDYDTSLFVDPSPGSGSDLEASFLSEEFNNLYGNLKFENSLLIRCPYFILIKDNKTLIPEFWIRLNKSLVEGGNVYIDWTCDSKKGPPSPLHLVGVRISPFLIKIISVGIHQYGFQWKGCNRLPIFKGTKESGYGYVLTKTREYSPKLGKEPKEIEAPGQMQTTVAKNIGRFSNVANSCFLDSLLFVLLISDGSNYIRPILFESDISDVPYNVKSVCDRSRTIKTRQQVRDMAHRVRNMLKTDYQRLRGGDVFQCNTLRQELRKCDPEIGTGVVYTPTEVYGIFAHLFPRLQIYFPPKIVVTENVAGQLNIPREDIGITQKITFSDSEYTPFSIREYGPQGPGSFYVWDDMNEPLLVFHNTGQKIKDFSEYIIKRRYRLFGAVMSRGRVSRTEEGGGHYNAYLRINGQWFYYDDMPPTTLRRLEKLPTKEVFEVGKRRIAELLFYERIQEIHPIPVKVTGIEKDNISYDQIESRDSKFRLTVKYHSEYAGRILQNLGGKLKMKGNQPTAYWLLDYDDVENKKDQIENAVRINITISPQGDGSVMIYSEDRYDLLGEKFRNIGGTLVERGVNYIGLNYHLRNRGGVLGDKIRDYYWKVPRENFNDTLSKIQKA